MYSLQTWAFSDWPAMGFIIFVSCLFAFLGFMFSSGLRVLPTFTKFDYIAGFIVFCVTFLGAFHLSYSSSIDRYNYRVTVAQEEIIVTENRYARVTRKCENADQFVEKTDKKYLVFVYECKYYQEVLRLELITLNEDLAYLNEHHAYRD